MKAICFLPLCSLLFLASFSAKAASPDESPAKFEDLKLAESLKTIEMVNIPAGNFLLVGSGVGGEKPARTVTVKAFKMLAHKVTFAQWDVCTAAGRCIKADDQGLGRGSHPVINVSWDDVQIYLDWLNEHTGEHFRLPSEAEWIHAAQAGSTTESWGDTVKAFGLYDMHGKVREWVQDCGHEDYNLVPADGSAWTSGDCPERLLRGATWIAEPQMVRLGERFRLAASFRNFNNGFRLAQDLPR